MKALAAALCGLLLAALPFTSALADTTYTYTGNQFNTFGGDAACPTECNIYGSFTISAPLGPNFDGYFTPDSFSFTDGLVTITQANATKSDFGFITNALGEITAWNLDFINAETSMYVGTGPSLICPVNCSVTDGSFAPSSLDVINYADIVNDPGVWTVSASTAPVPTPEPSSIALFGSGTLGLIGLVRRRLSA